MRHLGSWVVSLAGCALISCSTAHPPPPPPPPPPPAPCAAATGPVVNLAVDTRAAVNPDCVELRAGSTDVVWTAAPGVRYLLVAFKPGVSDRIPDPVCAGATCILEKVRIRQRAGEYLYTATVVLDDGTPASNDPKLIIKP